VEKSRKSKRGGEDDIKMTRLCGSEVDGSSPGSIGRSLALEVLNLRVLLPESWC